MPIGRIVAVASLVFAARVWGADLPDDAAKLVADFRQKRHELEAKAVAEVNKEAESLAKILQKIEESETKAHHDDAAAAVFAYRANMAMAPVPEPATKKPAKTFQDFIKTVEIVSHTYEVVKGQVTAQPTRLSVDGYLYPCKTGLNVVAVVDGKRNLEETYSTTIQFDKLILDIEALPEGAFVAIAVMNEVPVTISEKCNKAFRSIGAGQGVTANNADIAYLLIGAKGMRPGKATELMSGSVVEYPPPKKK